MLGAMRRLFGISHPRRIPVRQVPLVRARYDAAQTTPDNMRHWAAADALSANTANSPIVRKTLRIRSRYEVANNTYAQGIVLTLANDTVGTGPRLQVRSDDATVSRTIEREWTAWAKAGRLADLLRTMRVAKAKDGEAFAMLARGGARPGAVNLALRLLEADQVATPDLTWAPNAVDGIELDAYGDPAIYHVLKEHPGDGCLAAGEYERVAAAAMLHYFRVDRPGQYRGIPEITSALPLFAQLRRYTSAVLGAAETAADFAAVLFTDAPPDGAADLDPLDHVRLEKRMATTLPAGWKLGQMDAKQPTTTYREFKAEVLNEIARCLNMPFNVAACNSSSYNYASGRLDHQTYFRSIQVEQSQLERVVLAPLFRAWLHEARLAIPALRDVPVDITIEWMWDGREHVDPAKEANAQATRLASHTTTLAAEYARAGKDWEAELRQRARELALMRELGLTDQQALPAATVPAATKDQTDEQD